MKLAALLLLLIACAHGGAGVRTPVRATDRNAKLVEAVESYASAVTWRRSNYWRLEDDTRWPWHVIRASDQTACVLMSNTVFLPLDGEYFVCPTAWRRPRP